MFHLFQERYEGGATLLHIAAHMGSLQILSLLICEKVVADLVEINNRIKTAKEVKARDVGTEEGGDREEKENSAAYVNILKEALNSYDDTGNTPIHMAALSGNVEVFKFLMNAGSDATKFGFHGKTVFHYAAAKGHKALLKFMIFEALPYPLLTALDHNDNSAAMVAAASGYEKLSFSIEENIHEVRTKLMGR
jgi:ankyrin repeat protein